MPSVFQSQVVRLTDKSKKLQSVSASFCFTYALSLSLSCSHAHAADVSTHGDVV